MFKKVILVVALFPTLAFAALSNNRVIDSAPVLNSFTCQKYTDNELSMEQGYLTDNPATDLVFNIDQTKYEFIVKKNDLLKKDIRLTIPEGGNISGMSGNAHEMMFKRIDGDDKPYFVIYFTNSDPKSDGGINRAVFIAKCDKG
jgi:hypothetical protein